MKLKKMVRWDEIFICIANDNSHFPVSSDPAVLFIYRILVYSGEEQTFLSTSPLQLCLIIFLKIHKNR